MKFKQIYILYIIGFVIIVGCLDEKRESTKYKILYEQDKSKISFKEFINLIPEEKIINNVFNQSDDKFEQQSIQLKPDMKRFVKLSFNKKEELHLRNLFSNSSIESYHIYAMCKLNFDDSFVSIKYQFKHNTNSEDYYSFQILINYDNLGRILTILPLNFKIKQNEKIIECFSKLKKDEIVRFYNIQDTTKQCNGFNGKYQNNEYIEYLHLDKKGGIQILKKRTNVLEAFATSYVKVGIEDKRFKVHNPCNDTFHIIKFIPSEQNGNFYLIYKDENQEYKFEIISTYWISGKRFLEKEFIWKYEGDYIQLHLKNLETGDCKDGFLAIGSANNKRVHEFHFTDKFKNLKLYYTDFENVLNGKIKIQKPDCE